MGKTSVKIQLPDAKKAAKAAKRAALQKLADAVKEADALDPSEALAPFLAKPFVRNGLSTSVEAVPHASALSAADRKWMWNLLEKNMKPVYGSQAWKKEGKEKKEEMLSDDARFLVARNATAPSADRKHRKHRPKQPLGFVHYRFVLEEGAAVLYVYELQIAPGAAGGPRSFYDVASRSRASSPSGACSPQTATRSDEVLRVHEVAPRRSNPRPVGVRGGRVDYDIYQKVGETAKGRYPSAAQGEQGDVRRGACLHSNDELKDAFKKATIAA